MKEPDETRLICALRDLDECGSRAFALGTGDWPLRGFVVRRGAEVFAYLNRCPHAGHPLNLRPDRFLTPDRARILCNSHGAMFDIGSGRCVAGPCQGSTLQPLPIRISEGRVFLDQDPDALAADYA